MCKARFNFRTLTIAAESLKEFQWSTEITEIKCKKEHPRTLARYYSMLSNVSKMQQNIEAKKASNGAKPKPHIYLLNNKFDYNNFLYHLCTI